MVTSSNAEHAPLVTVHRTTVVVPCVRPVTGVLRLLGFTMVPDPLTNDHCPCSNRRSRCRHRGRRCHCRFPDLNLRWLLAWVALTYTTIVSRLVCDNPSVTRSIYWVVVVGVAIGLAAAGLLRPVVGSQEYTYGAIPHEADGAPPIVTLLPVQIVLSAPADARTKAPMLTVIWS